jgi:hypothetical protein
MLSYKSIGPDSNRLGHAITVQASNRFWDDYFSFPAFSLAFPTRRRSSNYSTPSTSIAASSASFALTTRRNASLKSISP